MAWLRRIRSNRNRKLLISRAPTKAKSQEPAYSQALNQNKIDRQRSRSKESGRQTEVRQPRVVVSAQSLLCLAFIAVNAENLASHRYEVENGNNIDKAMSESSEYTVAALSHKNKKIDIRELSPLTHF